MSKPFEQKNKAFNGLQPTEREQWTSINHNTHRNNYSTLQGATNRQEIHSRSLSSRQGYSDFEQTAQKPLYHLVGHKNPRSTSSKNIFSLGPPSPEPKQRGQAEPQTPYLYNDEDAHQTAAFNFNQLKQTPTVNSIKKTRPQDHHHYAPVEFLDQSLSLLQDTGNDVRMSHQSLNFDLSLIPPRQSRHQQSTTLIMMQPSSFESSIKEIPHFSLNNKQQLPQQQSSRLKERLDSLCKQNIVVDVPIQKPVLYRKQTDHESHSHKLMDFQQNAIISLKFSEIYITNQPLITHRQAQQQKPVPLDSFRNSSNFEQRPVLETVRHLTNKGQGVTQVLKQGITPNQNDSQGGGHKFFNFQRPSKLCVSIPHSQATIQINKTHHLSTMRLSNPTRQLLHLALLHSILTQSTKGRNQKYFSIYVPFFYQLICF